MCIKFVQPFFVRWVSWANQYPETITAHVKAARFLAKMFRNRNCLFPWTKWLKNVIGIKRQRISFFSRRTFLWKYRKTYYTHSSLSFLPWLNNFDDASNYFQTKKFKFSTNIRNLEKWANFRRCRHVQTIYRQNDHQQKNKDKCSLHCLLLNCSE